MIDTSLVTLVMTAPLTGWAAPLCEIPDPVFAGRMMGDGLAIDPIDGKVVSPCDGTVAHLHRARHAVTLHQPFEDRLLDQRFFPNCFLAEHRQQNVPIRLSLGFQRPPEE